MLVLARHPGQRILFPNLGIAVEVLSIKGNNIRLGIEAPPEIAIKRAELVAEPAPRPTPRQREHALRGRLNTAVMGLYVVEKQLRAGLTRDAEGTLQLVLEELQALDALFGEKPSAPAASKTIEALLVEDNRNEEALLAHYLRSSGFKIETVHDGCEALEYLASHERPDFVLLDMRMPRLGGPETVAAIRREGCYRSVKIFAVSGTAQDEAGVPIGAAGVDGWFRKPLNPARLVEAMQVAASRN